MSVLCQILYTVLNFCYIACFIPDTLLSISNLFGNDVVSLMFSLLYLERWAIYSSNCFPWLAQLCAKMKVNAWS